MEAEVSERDDDFHSNNAAIQSSCCVSLYFFYFYFFSHLCPLKHTFLKKTFCFTMSNMSIQNSFDLIFEFCIILKHYLQIFTMCTMKTYTLDSPVKNWNPGDKTQEQTFWTVCDWHNGWNNVIAGTYFTDSRSKEQLVKKILWRNWTTSSKIVKNLRSTKVLSMVKSYWNANWNPKLLAFDVDEDFLSTLLFSDCTFHLI